MGIFDFLKRKKKNLSKTRDYGSQRVVQSSVPKVKTTNPLTMPKAPTKSRRRDYDEEVDFSPAVYLESDSDFVGYPGDVGTYSESKEETHLPDYSPPTPSYDPPRSSYDSGYSGGSSYDSGSYGSSSSYDGGSSSSSSDSGSGGW